MALWFDAPYSMIQLSVSLYLALSAVLQLVVGPLADRFGRRRVVLGGIGMFLLATVGVLAAPTVELFLACRMAQAVIATGFVLSRAIVRDMVPDAEAASMIGYVTMGMSLVPMVGPVIGGALDEMFGWQASFVLLLVAGLAVMALVWADLGETSRTRSGGFAAQIRLYPALFGSRRFWGYSVCAAAGSGAFFSYLGGAPYVGSEVFGLTPAMLGFYFGVPALGYAAGNFLSGRFAVRFGLVRMVLAGTVVLVSGLSLLAILTLAGISHPALFFSLVGFIGLGNGIALPSANAGMMSIRPELAGTASGLGGFLTIGGGAALSVLAGIALERGEGEMPLVVIMLASSLIALLSILLVIRRNRQLGL
jgi:DHA1 family bicyclomycin/chloramphenicol resistance-like MFS transporter